MKKFIAFTFILVFSLSLLFGGSKNKSRPKWLENPKSIYNPQLYMTAIGEGDTRSDAENSAIASLSKIFESKVKVDETTKEEYRELIKNKRAESSTSTQIQKNVSLNSSQTLYNIQFGESFTDKLGRVYVLAYLDRLKTADIYLEKIEKNSQKIKEYLKNEKLRSEPIAKYSYLKSALTIAKWNNTLLAQLDIISPSMKDFNEIDYNIVQIKNEFDNIAKQIKFTIKIQSKNSQEIEDFLTTLINKFGFSIIDGESDFSIEGKAVIENLDLQRKQKFVHWNIFLKFLYKDEIVFSFEKSGREGHLSYELARNRALRTINKKLQKNFYKELMEYILKYSEM